MRTRAVAGWFDEERVRYAPRGKGQPVAPHRVMDAVDVNEDLALEYEQQLI